MAWAPADGRKSRWEPAAFPASLPLFDLPPSLLGSFCSILDSCDGALGWRGLAEHLCSSWLEVRHIEKYVEQGKSGTRDLLWSWARKTQTIGDLLQVLQEMGHERAINLIVNHGRTLSAPSKQSQQTSGFPNNSSQVTTNNTIDNVGHMPEYQKGISLKPSFNLKNIIEGTQNFHKDFLIGEGEFFKVFKVELQNGTYAVKLFKQEKTTKDNKNWKMFFSELGVLNLVHHPNILELVAYFMEAERFCLVYPYMSNGSLFDRLQCVDNTFPLSWQLRISILIGVARAIQNLHNTEPCSVICGNITSSNILLDHQFQPKLKHFVTAHLRPHLEKQSSTIHMESSRNKYLWYMPEEYIRQRRLSTKTDVYSFGIVIMEVLTGYKVVLEGPKYVRLRDLFVELMEKRGLESCLSLLDKKINPCPQNFSWKLFTLANQCVASRAKLRPTMDEVLIALESTYPILYFAEDPPQSLKSFRSPSPLFLDHLPSVPMENDESQDIGSPPKEKSDKDGFAQKTPLECSQSEVTFLGLDRKALGKEKACVSEVPVTSWEDNFSSNHIHPSQDSRVCFMSIELSSESKSPSGLSRLVEPSTSSESYRNKDEKLERDDF
ncbi:LOW QUALITY PROTEIN: interleukin-1 receptor-associated kinase 3 [Dromiciops gliroides]|uniref:LOW QUALITY PROTEIN: interleukin-1 receptor-associated kinase 3 n=1 Tax=Dromiciops gliroides TaxID=33562 RepID=UPI001CC477DA|nr:LOW QUALITY PROTEIN: interleukin-1 receptor-associated kinase 3 [Dromiciops gliroides]